MGVLSATTTGQPAGADLWRVVVPFVALHQLGYDVVWAPPKDLWRFQGGKLPAACLLPRMAVASAAGAVRYRDEMHATGTRIVLDYDDNFAAVPKDNPLYHHNLPWRHNKYFLEVADFVTVSTEPVREWLLSEGVRCPIRVEPNRVTEGLFERTPHEPLTVGIGGSPTHLHDWHSIQPELQKLVEIFRDVRFLLYGDDMERLLPLVGENVERRPWQDWGPYRRTVGEVDIGLCPLTPSVFNQYKSPLKWIEFGSLGVPCVVSPTVYGDYVDDGEDALVARTPRDWLPLVAALIEDLSLRRSIGFAAEETIRRRFTETPQTLAARFAAYVGEEN